MWCLWYVCYRCTHSLVYVFDAQHPKFLIPEPTARSAVRRGLLIPLGYLHPGKCEHSEVQSHPPCHGRTTNDGFCRYAHARVITDFKNMADYMKSERWLKASEKVKTKTTDDKI